VGAKTLQTAHFTDKMHRAQRLQGALADQVAHAAQSLNDSILSMLQSFIIGDTFKARLHTNLDNGKSTGN
jgi:hypothetical protein